jgi:alpha-beta hydrolase superfamily lysophospholipase
MLASRFDMSGNGHPEVYSMLIPCFTCSKDLKPIVNLSSALIELGLAVFRFDFTGLGESEGDFSNITYSMMLEDLMDAADYLQGTYGSPGLLIGHSLGGCLAIEAAHLIPSVKAVVTIGSPSEPSNISKKLSRTRNEAVKKGFAITEIGGMKFKLRRQFFEDIEKHYLEPFITGLNKPLLVMHSSIDTYGSINEGLKIFETAKQPKSFISLDKIDHLMLNKKDTLYIGGLISAWVKRYL